MDNYCIVTSDVILELSYGFKERLAFNIAYSTTDFDNCNFSIITAVISVKTAFNLVSYMRNNLNSTAAVISATLLL